MKLKHPGPHLHRSLSIIAYSPPGMERGSEDHALGIGSGNVGPSGSPASPCLSMSPLKTWPCWISLCIQTLLLIPKKRIWTNAILSLLGFVGLKVLIVATNPLPLPGPAYKGQGVPNQDQGGHYEIHQLRHILQDQSAEILQELVHSEHKTP